MILVLPYFGEGNKDQILKEVGGTELENVLSDLKLLLALGKTEEGIRELEHGKASKILSALSNTSQKENEKKLLKENKKQLEGGKIDIIKKKKDSDEKAMKKDEDRSAVQKALSVLLGEHPSEENKLTPEQFAAVLKLDDFLREEERKEEKRFQKVDNLVEKAIELIDGAVTLRENVEKRLIDGEYFDEDDEYDYEDFFTNLDLSPLELRDLLENKRK